MLNPFCRKFRAFLFLYFGQFSGIFGTLGRPLLELSQPQNFAWRGPCSAPGLSRKHRGQGPGFDSRRGARVQHIFLDIDDEKDEPEEHKDDEDEDEHDEDDEDENEDEDEFEDERG